MKRLALTVVIALILSAGAVQGKGPHHGSTGFQMGFYHYPPPGQAAPQAGVLAVPSAGYGYGYAVPGAGYAVPGYGYAAPGYGFSPMMAPSAGCQGGLGY